MNEKTDINRYHPQGATKTNGVKDEETSSDFPYTIETFLEYPPLAELKKLRDEDRWFEAVVLACAYFHADSILKIKKFLEKRKISDIGPKLIENLTLNECLILLRCIDLIDNSIYLMMYEIKEWRNDLVHDPEKIRRLKDKPLIARKLINNSTTCLEALRVAKI